MHTIIRMAVDFRRAALAVRETLAFSPEEARIFLSELRGETAAPEEAMLLSTCNRTEIYMAAANASGAVDATLEQLKRTRPGARPVYDDCRLALSYDSDAVRQICRVASGLESSILGDSQIASQLRSALTMAREAGTAGRHLGVVSEAALRAARRVRTETALAAGSAGVGAAVLRTLRRWSPDVSALRVVVLGAGRAARDIASHVIKVKPAALIFCARRSEQSELLAREFQAAAAQWSERFELTATAGAIIAATTAPLDCLQVANWHRLPAATRLIIDAGVPRNADPGLATLPGVHLADIDSLEREQREALEKRRQQIPIAERIIDEEIHRWRRRIEWLSIEPMVKDLYLAAEQVRRSVVAAHGGGQDLDNCTARLTRSLLAGPVRRLRKSVLAGADAEVETKSTEEKIACRRQW